MYVDMDCVLDTERRRPPRTPEENTDM